MNYSICISNCLKLNRGWHGNGQSKIDLSEHELVIGKNNIPKAEASYFITTLSVEKIPVVLRPVIKLPVKSMASIGTR